MFVCFVSPQKLIFFIKFFWQSLQIPEIESLFRTNSGFQYPKQIVCDYIRIFYENCESLKIRKKCKTGTIVKYVVYGRHRTRKKSRPRTLPPPRMASSKSALCVEMWLCRTTSNVIDSYFWNQVDLVRYSSHVFDNFQKNFTWNVFYILLPREVAGETLEKLAISPKLPLSTHFSLPVLRNFSDFRNFFNIFNLWGCLAPWAFSGTIKYIISPF